MKYLSDSLWVALGASLGANARFWIGFICKSNVQEFPWPTLLINVIGSSALGFFSAAALERGWPWSARPFYAVGVCGGFTTFSTFSFEVIDLFFRKSWRAALVYAAISFVLSIAGCLGGGHIGRVLFGQRETPSNPFAAPTTQSTD